MLPVTSAASRQRLTSSSALSSGLWSPGTGSTGELARGWREQPDTRRASGRSQADGAPPVVLLPASEPALRQLWLLLQQGPGSQGNICLLLCSSSNLLLGDFLLHFVKRRSSLTLPQPVHTPSLILGHKPVRGASAPPTGGCFPIPPQLQLQLQPCACFLSRSIILNHFTSGTDAARLQASAQGQLGRRGIC